MTRRWIPLLTASMLALAACGGGDDDGGSTDAPRAGEGREPREGTVGMLPILPPAGLCAGSEERFFEDRGLEVTVETGQGGAALLRAVMAGQIDCATSNPVSLLQARGEDLDVR